MKELPEKVFKITKIESWDENGQCQLVNIVNAKSTCCVHSLPCLSIVSVCPKGLFLYF